MMTRS
jgi:Ca2+-binding EF-hand superfamily protein